MTVDIETLVHHLIAAHGPLTVAQFMELALQHPTQGYYRTRDPLGRDGDFVTAPEISQMFGELVGLWCVDVWQKMGCPDSFTLLELGPGRGTLMQDALRAASRVSAFMQAKQLCLFESSEALRTIQAERLAAYAPRWLDDLAALSAQPLLVIANEFFDALPVRQFAATPTGWAERVIVKENGALRFALTSPDPAIQIFLSKTLSSTEEGAVTEICPAAHAILRQLSTHVARHGGAGLIIDYGYVATPGHGTLQAVKRHQKISPLDHIGEADLTALVDFSALRATAEQSGTRPYGPVGQGDFLRALSIDTRARQLAAQQGEAAFAALHRLTDATAMGELFKVLAFARHDMPELAGFGA